MIVATTRECTKCGKKHNMVVQNRKTGEVLELVDVCYDCLFDYKYVPITEQITLDDHNN